MIGNGYSFKNKVHKFLPCP